MNKGDRIKHHREMLGLAQTEVANSIGVSKQTLYKYENNIVTNIPSDKIEALARVLGTTPEYLMGWEDEPSQKSPEELEEELKEGLAFNILLNGLTTEEQEEIREIVKLLLVLPRYERQFLRDWLTNHGKQP